jgi:uncharacterized protein
MKKITAFKPAWWLTGSHFQTIWPVVSRRKIALSIREERIELPDGDFLDLNWIGDNNDQIVLVLHGLGGSIESPYANGIMNAILAAGWQGVFMHFRGCSHECNRLARSYHSGETADLDFIIKEIVRRTPKAKIAVIGYSLGGNVLLKWLGETGSTAPITCAVAVSVPFELNKAADRMNLGFSQIYQWWLLRQLKSELSRKFKRIPSPININNLKKLRTFWEFDDQVTAPLHGFKGVNDYYHRSSSRQYLKNIHIPTLVIHSLDDPFISPNAIPNIDEISEKITLEVSKSGGHVGFISGIVPGRAKYWLEDRIPAYLIKHI